MFQIQHVHPMLVHFPIVLVLLLAAYETVATMRGQVVSGRGWVGSIATLLVVLVAVSAALTYQFGGIALTFAEDQGFSSDIAEIHESLGEMFAISTIIYALARLLLWWRDIRLQGALNWIFPLLAIVGSALVLVVAYYGGQLVYDLGVNVSGVVQVAH